MRGGSKIRRGAIGGGMMNVIGTTTLKDLSSNTASKEARSLSAVVTGGSPNKSIQMRLTELTTTGYNRIRCVFRVYPG